MNDGVPWLLDHERPPTETRTILAAVVAVLSALCQDREDRGWVLPTDGIDGLIETALAAWTIDAPECDRLAAAYTWTLEALE